MDSAINMLSSLSMSNNGCVSHLTHQEVSQKKKKKTKKNRTKSLSSSSLHLPVAAAHHRNSSNSNSSSKNQLPSTSFHSQRRPSESSSIVFVNDQAHDISNLVYNYQQQQQQLHEQQQQDTRQNSHRLSLSQSNHSHNRLQSLSQSNHSTSRVSQRQHSLRYPSPLELLESDADHPVPAVHYNYNGHNNNHNSESFASDLSFSYTDVVVAAVPSTNTTTKLGGYTSSNNSSSCCTNNRYSAKKLPSSTCITEKRAPHVSTSSYPHSRDYIQQPIPSSQFSNSSLLDSPIAAQRKFMTISSSSSPSQCSHNNDVYYGQPVKHSKPPPQQYAATQCHPDPDAQYHPANRQMYTPAQLVHPSNLQAHPSTMQAHPSAMQGYHRSNAQFNPSALEHHSSAPFAAAPPPPSAAASQPPASFSSFFNNHLGQVPTVRSHYGRQQQPPAIPSHPSKLRGEPEDVHSDYHHHQQQCSSSYRSNPYEQQQQEHHHSRQEHEPVHRRLPPAELMLSSYLPPPPQSPIKRAQSTGDQSTASLISPRTLAIYEKCFAAMDNNDQQPAATAAVLAGGAPSVVSIPRGLPFAEEDDYHSNHVEQHQQIEIAPGEFRTLRGTGEILRAIESGNSQTVYCFGCGIPLQCIGDCEMVVCPDCRIVSPIILCDDDSDANNDSNGMMMMMMEDSFTSTTTSKVEDDDFVGALLPRKGKQDIKQPVLRQSISSFDCCYSGTDGKCHPAVGTHNPLDANDDDVAAAVTGNTPTNNLSRQPQRMLGNGRTTTTTKQKQSGTQSLCSSNKRSSSRYGVSLGLKVKS